MIRFNRSSVAIAAMSLSFSAIAQVPGGMFDTPARAVVDGASTGTEDDVTLTAIPGSFFATEGPIWNLHTATQEITVVGKCLTMPKALYSGNLLPGDAGFDPLNEIPFGLTGSSVLSNDGEAATPINAGVTTLQNGTSFNNFTRMCDSNATTRDTDFASVDSLNGMGVRRIGATRSIFSTSEGQRDGVATQDPSNRLSLERDPAAQAQIEQNFWTLVEIAYEGNTSAPSAGTSSLPLDFLSRVGFGRGPGGSNLYPTTAGGTLKSAGRLYTADNGPRAGELYWICDEEMVCELSENVSSGDISSCSRGFTNGGNIAVDSFVMNDMLVIFNQDPRFGADVLGVGELEVHRHIFYDRMEADLAAGTPFVIDLIGHTIGEHVLFVQEVLTELVDESQGFVISADRFRFRQRGGSTEARWRGIAAPLGDISPAAGGTFTSTWTLHARFADSAGNLILDGNAPLEFDVPYQLVDPNFGLPTDNGTATYDFRERGITGLPAAGLVVMILRDGNGVQQALESFEVVFQ